MRINFRALQRHDIFLPFHLSARRRPWIIHLEKQFIARRGSNVEIKTSYIPKRLKMLEIIFF